MSSQWVVRYFLVINCCSTSRSMEQSFWCFSSITAIVGNAWCLGTYCDDVAIYATNHSKFSIWWSITQVADALVEEIDLDNDALQFDEKNIRWCTSTSFCIMHFVQLSRELSKNILLYHTYVFTSIQEACLWRAECPHRHQCHRPRWQKTYNVRVL